MSGAIPVPKGKETSRTSWLAAAGLLVLAAALCLGGPSVAGADPGELQMVRQAIKAKGAKWQAEETPISKLGKEARRKRLGLLEAELPPTGAEAPAGTAASPVGTAPASLDWRSFNGMNYVTPVKNQGNCGSCWAFAAAACLESQILLGKDMPGATANVSEQALVSCSGAGSCGGGTISGASNYIRDVGLPVEACFPYTASDASCGEACLTCKTETATIFGWHYATAVNPTVEAVKNALATYGPLVATMTVYGDFYYYRSGIYSYTSGTAQGGHAVLIVGYDDPGQYFIVKNSWGTSWGEQGYFRIAYSQLNSVVYFARYTIAYEGWRGDPDNPPEPACSYSLSASGQTFPATGGEGSVGVSAGSGCTWTAASNAAWITLAGSGGTGSSAVAFQVAANPSKFTRTGTLTIAGQTFTVTQKGARVSKK